MTLSIDQIAAIEKLSRLKAGALFMEMGTGKTRTAVELIKSKQSEIDLVVWITDASLLRKPEYHNEIRKWSNRLLTEFKFYTIEGVSQSDSSYLDLINSVKNKTVFCVIDESLSIKNTESKRTQRLLQIRDKFAFRLILNGTPATKGLYDLYSQINFIHPKILNMSEEQFANTFLIYKKDGVKPWKRWSKPENEEALIEIIRPYIYDSKLEFTKNVYTHERKLSLNFEENYNYIEFKNSVLDKNEHLLQVNFLAIANAFQHFYTICDNKISSFDKDVDKIHFNNEKVIVFVKFLDEIEILRKRFPCVVSTGKEKESLTDFENGNKKVLLSTYGTGSKGHNWQYANHLIFFSQTFDYSHKIHGIHRIKRHGQNSNINIYDYQVNTGLDDLIIKSCNKKDNTCKNLKRFIMENGRISREKLLKF